VNLAGALVLAYVACGALTMAVSASHDVVRDTWAEHWKRHGWKRRAGLVLGIVAGSLIWPIVWMPSLCPPFAAHMQREFRRRYLDRPGFLVPQMPAGRYACARCEERAARWEAHGDFCHCALCDADEGCPDCDDVPCIIEVDE
jgi:hypothetical protein